MAPVKAYRFQEYEILTSCTDLHEVGPRVLRYARSKPEKVIEFLSLYEKARRVHFLEYCHESDCETCELELEFNRTNEVSFRSLYRDMKFAQWAGGFLVTTAKTCNSNNLVAFSVKPLSFFSLRSPEEQTVATVVKITVPSIRDLQDSIPPVLRDIVEEMKRCSSNHSSLGRLMFLEDQSSEDLAQSRVLNFMWTPYGPISELYPPSAIPLRITTASLTGDKYSLPSNIVPIYRRQTHFRSDQVHIQIPDEAWPFSIFPTAPSSEYQSFPNQSQRASFGSQNREVDKPLFNRARLSEGLLMIVAQTGMASWAIGSSGVTSLSNNARTLFYSAVSCDVIGFICWLYNILVFGRRAGLAARITNGIGYTASVYGFLALMGMLMPENVMLEITGVVCVASFPALAHAFMR